MSNIQDQIISRNDLANLLACLHIGEGIHRDLLQDSLALERVSQHVCTITEKLCGTPSYPCLAEDILEEAEQLGLCVNTKAACDVAHKMFHRCITDLTTKESLKALRISHSFLVSALHRVVRDQHSGIPAHSVSFVY